MGSVAFTDLQQFVDELTIGHAHVDRQLVRLAVFEREGFWSSIVRRDHLVATARIGRDLVRLDLHYSPYGGGEEHEHAESPSQRVASDVARITRACGKLKLRIGGGVLEETAGLRW